MRKLFASLALSLSLASISFAAQQPVNVGTVANDHTGDALRSAFTKLNANDAELYAKFPVSVANGGTGATTITGVLKGNGTSAVTAASVSDLLGLFTGSCTVSVPLRGDGSCGTIPSSAVSGLAASATTDATNAANISSGTLPAGRLPALTGDCTTTIGTVATTCTKTGGVAFATSATTDATNATNISTGTLAVARGGIGVGTLTAHGVLLGEGTSAVSAVAALAADNLLLGQGATSDPAATSVPNCGSSSQALAYSTTTHTFSCQSIVGTGAALTSTQMGFGNASNVLTGSTNLTWTDASRTMTLGGSSGASTITTGLLNGASAGGLSILVGANTFFATPNALLLQGSNGSGAGVGGGEIDVNAGTSGSSIGGAVKLLGGSSGGSSAGGAVGITAGAGGSTGIGGAVTLTGGAGGGTSGAGGGITLLAGAAGNSATNGGNLSLSAGPASATAGSTGGTAALNAGAASTTGTGSAGSAVTITASNAGGTGNNVGGSVTLTAGTATGTGAPGAILLKSNTATLAAFGGTKFTTSGCSVSSTTGGAAAGTFTLGANTCTVVVTINGASGATASNGWSCQAHDRTAPTTLIGGESSSTTTTASITIPAGAGATDVISFSCTGY